MWRLLCKDAVRWGLPITGALVIMGIVRNRPSLDTVLTFRFLASVVGLLGLGVVASFVAGLLLRKLRLDPGDDTDPG